MNPKPMASLSSSLLARKGHARPAMRPQGFVSLSPSHGDDLGWNDMGDEPVSPQPIASVAPVMPAAVPPAPAPEVHRQLAALEQFAEPVPAPVAVPKPAIAKGAVVRAVREAKAAKSKAAFTLRLDTDRHLRLRLASAVTNRSAQQIVTEALDAFLESLTDVDTLASQISAREGRTGS